DACYSRRRAWCGGRPGRCLRTEEALVTMSQRTKYPLSELREAASSLRLRLEGVFALDTAVLGAKGDSSSAGHCAAVAAVVQEVLGGRLVSAKVEGESHWFNRLPGVDATHDVDLTGD